MRQLSMILFAVAMLGTVGCSSKIPPAEPANLSPEQLEAAKQEQKKAGDSERAHQKADSSYSKDPSNSVDEEERRAKR